jgi:hypothetical protein
VTEHPHPRMVRMVEFVRPCSTGGWQELDAGSSEVPASRMRRFSLDRYAGPSNDC